MKLTKGEVIVREYSDGEIAVGPRPEAGFIPICRIISQTDKQRGDAERIKLCLNSHDTLKAKAKLFDKMVKVLEAILDSTVYADAEGLIYIEEGGCDDAEHREIVAQAKAVIKAAKAVK